MTTSVEPTKASESPADDAELIEELAKLQHMHQQIHELRRLLPTALLSPARDAISQPRRANPQQVAFKISKAAQTGRQDIQAFKKEWHDDKMKQLFKEASVADIPQGVDAWLVDYHKLSMSGTKYMGPQLQSENLAFDTVDQAKKVLEDFEKSEHKVKLQRRTGDSDPFPIELQIARLQLRVQRNEDNYGVDSTSKEPLAHQIAEYVTGSGPHKSLEKLLNLLEAYEDIRLHKCESCKSLVDSNFDLPLVRRADSEPASGASSTKWLAFHRSCET